MPPMLLILANAAAHVPLPMQWAQFSRSGALSHISEIVDVATGSRTKSTAFPYRLRFTKYSFKGAYEIKWADSSTCPAVRSVIDSMRNIKMPSPAPYGITDGDIIVTADGAEYKLTAPSSDVSGELTIRSNVGSPLAAWIDNSFKQLASCWTTAAL
jgi:hypothetical protein